MKFLLSLLYKLWGVVILFPVVLYSKYKGYSNLPKLFYVYDNEEDGYDGNKRKQWYSKYGTQGAKLGWYDGYLGIDSSKMSTTMRTWYAYRWCALRNPAWNLRYHKYISINANKVKYDITGNTKSHDWKRGYQWYDVLIDNKYESHFRLIPLTKYKSLYVRWGWKIYPEFYGKELPKYKRRSLQTITLRVRGPKK